MAGLPMLVAISAPTGLAITIFSHPERVVDGIAA